MRRLSRCGVLCWVGGVLVFGASVPVSGADPVIRLECTSCTPGADPQHPAPVEPLDVLVFDVFLSADPGITLRGMQVTFPCSGTPLPGAVGEVTYTRLSCATDDDCWASVGDPPVSDTCNLATGQCNATGSARFNLDPLPPPAGHLYDFVFTECLTNPVCSMAMAPDQGDCSVGGAPRVVAAPQGPGDAVFLETGAKYCRGGIGDPNNNGASCTVDSDCFALFVDPICVPLEYLGTADYVVSESACGSFEIATLDDPATLLRDVNSDPIAFTTASLTLTVTNCASLPPCEFVSSVPAHDETLGRSVRNIARLAFSCSQDLVAPNQGAVLIQEMFEGGGFGRDISAFFSFTVEGVDTLKVQEVSTTSSELEHGKWYAVHNVGGWTDANPFELHFLAQIGDVGNDGMVLNNDVGLIHAAIGPADGDDDRRDVNGDGSISSTDADIASAHVPSPPVDKPAGH